LFKLQRKLMTPPPIFFYFAVQLPGNNRLAARLQNVEPVRTSAGPASAALANAFDPTIDRAILCINIGISGPRRIRHGRRARARPGGRYPT
jgi:hypothetical protein